MQDNNYALTGKSWSLKIECALGGGNYNMFTELKLCLERKFFIEEFKIVFDGNKCNVKELKFSSLETKFVLTRIKNFVLTNLLLTTTI